MRELIRSRAFAVVALALSLTMLSTTLPTPLYALYRERLGFSELMVTVIFASYASGVIAALAMFGSLSDQIGRRKVLLSGLVFAALSAVAFLLANGLPLLLAGRILSGLSAGIFTGTATATLVDLGRPNERGYSTLVAAVANIGGLGCGPLLAGVVSEWGSSPLRLIFWIDLALLAAAAIGIYSVPEPVKTLTRPRLRPHALSIPRELRVTFTHAALAAFAGTAVLGLFTAVAPAFLSQDLGVTNRAAVGLVVFSVFAASAVGQVLLERLDESTALAGGCLALIAGMGFVAVALAFSSLAMLVVGGAVAGVGQGMTFRAGLAAVNAGAPSSQRSQIASTYFIVTYVGLAVPVVGVGLLAQANGLRPAGLVFTGAVALLAAAVLGRLVRRAADPRNALDAGRQRLLRRVDRLDVVNALTFERLRRRQPCGRPAAHR
jgi:MFS family permease